MSNAEQTPQGTIKERPEEDSGVLFLLAILLLLTVVAALAA